MTDEIFQGNIAVCPNCQHTFKHNKVNGLAIIEAVSNIDARKRMYCRLTLDQLEKMALDSTLTFDLIKKLILDNFNDFNRDIQTILGWGADE
jgi:hypothetical protein